MDAEREAAAPASHPVNSCNESFRTEVERTTGACIVRLFGSAGMEHAEDLRRQLLELPGAGSARVVLDLSELHFINSAGLGAFIALYRKCHELNGQVALASPRRAVDQVLRVTNLDRLMPIYPNVETALKQLPQPSP